MPTYVGLDCGGSSSRVVAMNDQGTILFQGQAGGANLASTPEKVLTNNLRRAVYGCPDADYVCGCFAGLLTNEDRDRAIYHLRHVFPTAVLRAEPDYAAALYASQPDPDVCVIAGTGSLVCSISKGRVVKSGGGGYVLGDFGSAFHFGKDALAHFLFGDEPPSDRLTNEIVELFGSIDPNAIVAKVYRVSSPAAHIARLAKSVGQDAHDELSYALQSLDRNLGLLADLVTRHLKINQLDVSPYDHKTPLIFGDLDIVLAGGVWKAGHKFREVFHSQLEKRVQAQSIKMTVISQPPVRGALRIALELPRGN